MARVSYIPTAEGILIVDEIIKSKNEDWYNQLKKNPDLYGLIDHTVEDNKVILSTETLEDLFICIDSCRAEEGK